MYTHTQVAYSTLCRLSLAQPMVPTAGAPGGRRNWLVPASGGSGEDTGETQYPRFFPFEVILEPQEQCWVWLLLLSCLVVSDSLDPHGLHHARLPCPSPSPGACSNSCPLSQWCHPLTISSLAASFSACPQSFPASKSFPMSWLFASGDSVNSKLKKICGQSACALPR